ncbi:ATP-binding protein [Actinomadura sp. NBRC 104412]|uniref:ATP-binding protein n=1 Tax=Actinomadura sp. NBRC 104412 TaxID=3032203 RepID=UPI0024A183D2|nr:ATP-binding protein [Actinomadura sp. NBRC 104412]GLZ08719.1 ATP-binding protein [Actinomadura sp. NBRC 104412]
MSLALLPAAEPAVPLYWRRTFPGRTEQARAARGFVGCLLSGCPYLDDVQLTAGELVGNALRHTRSGQEGGAFTVEVLRGCGGVVIAVGDQGGPTEPVVHDADRLAEGGRGLLTIACVAESWGWHGDEHGRKVTVTFVGEWTE